MATNLLPYHLFGAKGREVTGLGVQQIRGLRGVNDPSAVQDAAKQGSPSEDLLSTIAMRALQAFWRAPKPLTSSIGLFIPSIKKAGTKLIPRLPSSRWRMTPLTSLDGFQTAVLSRPLHLVRFAVHLWTPLSAALVEVAIQLKADAAGSLLHLLAVDRIGNEEKVESEVR